MNVRSVEILFVIEFVWILLINVNWKYYNKIIFKCLNSTVRPSFKEKFQKSVLTGLWTVHGTHTKTQMHCYPNPAIEIQMNLFTSHPNKLGHLWSLNDYG